MPAVKVEQAPAKINLTLRVLHRRPDGFHELESLVAFARIADSLTLTPGPKLELLVRGPMAVAAGAVEDNLVLKAAHALAQRIAGLKFGRFQLAKRLPVAAGLGGGSSDAAAALRLLARTNELPKDDPRLMQAARATGADVPVCLDPRPRLMRGIGDILSSPLTLARVPMLLVNPGVMVATKDVFGLLSAHSAAAVGDVMSIAQTAGAAAELVTRLATFGNDLEAPAIALAPAIADVLAKLRSCPGCGLARMSGSGATCFGLFESTRKASAAAAKLRAEFPSWWIRATAIGA